jgi:4-amino-4-deoxy-L-arabinose transferase
MVAVFDATGYGPGREAWNRWVPAALARTGPAAGGLWFVAVLLAFTLLFNGVRPLWAPDEGRYVAGALEMLRRHDFVGIFLNDDTAHFAKPPLTYWSLAAALALLGHSEFVARLPNALAFVATALLLWQAGRVMVPRMPMLPMILYATMVLPFLASNFITTDTLATLFIALAGVSYLHLEAGIAPRRAAIGMWIGFGLAFLTKGPPTLLALPVFFGWFAYRRDRIGLRRIFVSPGAALFVVIASSWYLLANSRFPGLLDYLLRAEVAGRITSDAFQRNSEWYGGLLVFGPTMLIGGLPWLPIWLAGRRRRGFAPALAEPADRLLLLWIGVPLLIFLVSRSRLPLYVLPLFVPLSLWLARRFEPAVSRLRPARVGLVFVTGLALLAAAKWGIAQPSPPKADGRATAALVTRASGGRVDDVVYVDNHAAWALRFYLGAQVREAWLLRARKEPDYATAPTLTQLLGHRKDQRTRVFMVNPASTDEFQRALRDVGLCAQELGHDAVSVVYRAAPAGPGSCQPSTGTARGPHVHG